MSFQLRDYQTEALDAIGAGFQRGLWSQIMVLPTGCGKTEIFARLRQSLLGTWLDAYPPQDQKILVLVHRDELIQQAAKKFRAANPDLNIGIERADERASWLLDDVVVASMQTLQGKRLAKLDPAKVRIVIVDEAHHAPSDSYQNILRHLELLPPAELRPATKRGDLSAARAGHHVWWDDTANFPSRMLLGVTATPARSDAVGLEWTFRSVVYEKTLRYMIERGYLAPLRGYLVDTQLSLDGVKVTAGDFNTLALAEAVNTPARNAATVIAWKQQAPGRRSLAFTVDIQHAKDLAAAFQAQGVAASWISGDDPERGSKITRYRAGEIPVLCNAQLLTEGFDDPDTSCVIMARPTTSQALYVQCVGRGTRLAPGKADCLVLDVADVSKRHSLVTIGDLFGLPAKFDVKGEDVLQTAALVERLQAENPDATISGQTIEAVRKAIKEIDLWQVRDSSTVAQYAKLLWIEDTPQKFHLPLPRRNPERENALDTRGPRERVEIREDMLGAWMIVHYAAIDERTLQQVTVATAETLADAFARGERWVDAMRPDVARMKRRDAPWAKKQPTDKQRQLLRRLGSPRWSDASLSRGDASALIDQATAGRKGYGSQSWRTQRPPRTPSPAGPPAAPGQRAISLDDDVPF